MEKVFNVFRTDASFNEGQHWVTTLHGRALADIEIGNELVSDASNCIMRVIKIVTYGHSLESIPASMGCALTVVSDDAVEDGAEWLSA